MKHPAPTWLAAFQVDFTRVLRAPLDRTTGTLTAEHAHYPDALVEDVQHGAPRLAVYNRQYWFRLLDVLQSAFPLTARLMGFWSFNEIAARYLVARPPQSWDLDAAPDDFADAFAAQVTDDGLVEAARIDAAYREVFRAPDISPFRPTAADAGHLLTSRLVTSPALRLVHEHRPLLALRRELMSAGANDSSRLPLPPRVETPSSWAILRTAGTTRALPLEPREAELLALLAEHRVADALARLEAATPTEARASLPEQARAWLGRGVAAGFFSGLERPAR